MASRSRYDEPGVEPANEPVLERIIEPYRSDDQGVVTELAASEGLPLEPDAEVRRGHALLWVARRAAQAPAQGYLLAWEVADELELLHLVIDRTARRRGFGGALLDELLAHGRRRGLSAVHLEVRVSNEGALTLYRSRGFREEGVRRGYYGDGEDALVLTLPLPVAVALDRDDGAND